MRQKTLITNMLILWMICLSAPGYAQEGVGRGRIKGVVTDETGAPVEGVQILATYSSGRSFKAETDEDGEWAIGGLGSGMFRFIAQKEGYESAFIDKEVSQFRNKDIELTIKKIAAVPEGVPRVDDSESMAVLKAGTDLYEQEQYAEALQKFKEFFELNPTLTDIRINIAACFRELGQYENALAEYQALLDEIARDKGSLEGDAKASGILADMGGIYARQGDLDKASDYFQQSIDINPKDERVAFNVAEICFKQGESAKAVSYYQMAININPEWSKPYPQLGYAYLNMGDYAGAVESFNKFLKIDPENPQAQTIKNLIPSIEKLIKK